VDVEVIHNEVPALCAWIRSDHCLDMGHKVLLFASSGTVGSNDLAACHISAEDERARATADVLELAPLNLTGR
jgi:hypothetical protein